MLLDGTSPARESLDGSSNPSKRWPRRAEIGMGGRVELIGSMMGMIEFRASQLRWIPRWEGPWENDDGRRTRQSQGDIRKSGKTKTKRIWFLGGGIGDFHRRGHLKFTPH